MPPEKIADAILKAIGINKKTVVLRLLDCLIVWGNIFIPGLIGRMAARQYRVAMKH